MATKKGMATYFSPPFYWIRDDKNSATLRVPLASLMTVLRIRIRIQDPYVSGPPGSGSGSFYHRAKIIKNIDSYCCVTSL